MMPSKQYWDWFWTDFDVKLVLSFCTAVVLGIGMLGWKLISDWYEDREERPTDSLQLFNHREKR